MTCKNPVLHFEIKQSTGFTHIFQFSSGLFTEGRMALLVCGLALGISVRSLSRWIQCCMGNQPQYIRI